MIIFIAFQSLYLYDIDDETNNDNSSDGVDNYDDYNNNEKYYDTDNNIKLFAMKITVAVITITIL